MVKGLHGSLEQVHCSTRKAEFYFKSWFQKKTWLYNFYFLNLFSKLKMIHDLDNEVFLNLKAKPMWNTILTSCLAKIKSRPVLFPPFKGKSGPNLSLPSIKSKLFSILVLPSHFGRLCYQEHVSFLVLKS